MTTSPSAHRTDTDSTTIDPEVSVGHVHLKVSDLDQSLAFWRDLLGFEVTTRYGRDAVFLSAGGYHHHIALNTWQSKGGAPPPSTSTGLFHVALLFPTRTALAVAVKRLVDGGWPIQGASDHGVSQAVYTADPDGNGVELYWDRPRDQWPEPDNENDQVGMFTRALDFDELMSHLPTTAARYTQSSQPADQE